MRQQERIKKGGSRKGSSAKSRDDSFDAEGGDTLENITEASTRKQSNTLEQISQSEGTSHHNFGGDDEFDEEEEDEEDDKSGTQKIITAQQVRDLIQRLWSKEKDILELMFGRYHPVAEGEPFQADSLGYKMFFINKLLVPPNRFRPESQGGLGNAGGQGDKAFLHAHSAMLTKIMNLNFALNDLLLKDKTMVTDDAQSTKGEKQIDAEVIQKWIQLQDAINTFMDSSMAQKTADREQNGLRQLLERKEGMFRMKMMGKRVNFGGRSVISPDPYITTDQIGVPIFMARKLTFPNLSQISMSKD